jgi:hypothetical protein
MAMARSRGRTQRPRRKGPTPRKRPVPVNSGAAEQAKPVTATARYTPPKNRGIFRPTWHKLVGGASIVVGIALFFTCEFNGFKIHNYGGHIWYLVGLALAASSLWWFGAMDRSETRW